MADPLRVPDIAAAQPILTHEKSLTKKVAKGSEAGDIYDQQILMLGTQLVTQISILIKMSKLHGRTNTALDSPVESALTVIKALAQDEPISVRLQNDFLFLGQRHLKITAAQMPVFSTVIDTLNQWCIGGVSFSKDVESRDFRELIFQLGMFDAANSSISTLRASLDQQSVKGIELEERRVLRGKSIGQEPVCQCGHRGGHAGARQPRERHDRLQASQTRHPKHRRSDDERRGIALGPDDASLS